jgi:hypothetical protein
MVAYAELVAARGSLLVSLPILFRALQLPAGHYFATVWRPMLASFLAAGAVYAMLDIGGHDGSLAMAIEQLALGLPAGLISYVALLWGLWRLSGRPESAEAMVGRRLQQAIVGLRDRIKGARAEP